MNVLSIAGSDPSGGAGVQSDLKTFSQLGVQGFTVITVITSQNSQKISKIQPLSSTMIKSQLESVLSDFPIDCVKIGMVYNSAIIKAIVSKIQGKKFPIVVDPIFKSTTGSDLLEKRAVLDFKKLLLPLASVITPNVDEASQLSGISIKKIKDLKLCAAKIKKSGVKNLVITGFRLKEKKIADFVFEGNKSYLLSGKLLPKVNHGSGCNFSASLTVAIAKKKNLHDAVSFAKNYTYNSIKNAQKIGKGIEITNPSHIDKNKKELQQAILKLKNLKNFYLHIPECQTNFVYSKLNPNSIEDVLGIEGRVVKAGKTIMVAGNLEYGGSQHVASAILSINKKFPKIRSAINIKYNPKIVAKFKTKGYIIKNYDRTKESASFKKFENTSVSWGIKSAIKKAQRPPDVIFHKGDHGKEPMVLVFGKNPQDVIKKITKIL